MTKQAVLERINVLEKSLEKSSGSEHRLSDILERQGLYILLEYLEWQETSRMSEANRRNYK